MSTTLLTLLAALRPLTTPLGDWDWHAPTPCRWCGLPALDHDVLGERLVCPGTGEGIARTFTLKEAR